MDEDGIVGTLEKRMVEIDLVSGNKGVYIFDRGFDRRHIFEILHRYEMSFIVRACDKRNLVLDSSEEKFRDIVSKVKLKYSTNTNKGRVNCNAIKVNMRMEGHPVKNPTTTQMWLVVAKFQNNTPEGNGYFYLCCNFLKESDLSPEQICKKAIYMYGLRWTIEEYHKHVKKECGWEAIQLTSYLRNQNMNKFLLLAMCFLYSLNGIVVYFVEAYPAIMEYTKGEALDGKFIFYRLSKAASECLRQLNLLLIRKLPGKRKDVLQMVIPGF